MARCSLLVYSLQHILLAEGKKGDGLATTASWKKYFSEARVKGIELHQ